MTEPIEMDFSGLDIWPEQRLASNDLASQLVASIQEELVTTVVTELVASMNSLTERVEHDQARHDRLMAILDRQIEQAEADRAALVAALTAMTEAISAQSEPVVNLTLPEQPVTVNVPETVVNVAAAPAPQVDVHLPPANRKVKVKRDPLSGLIASVDVEEV